MHAPSCRTPLYLPRCLPQFPLTSPCSHLVHEYFVSFVACPLTPQRERTHDCPAPPAPHPSPPRPTYLGMHPRPACQPAPCSSCALNMCNAHLARMGQQVGGGLVVVGGPSRAGHWELGSPTWRLQRAWRTVEHALREHVVACRPRPRLLDYKRSPFLPAAPPHGAAWRASGASLLRHAGQGLARRGVSHAAVGSRRGGGRRPGGSPGGGLGAVAAGAALAVDRGCTRPV